ncbi:sensor histidine kinase [Hugenholtzia roseola]|uniref:sensor histidine kinase n=1 Tax=Hugenholtzia roseola TaxID=1002 RepID=UPI0004039EA2|nr:HAMP domain-containing sensor histidine kinase [Hugenholtzia roseola]
MSNTTLRNLVVGAALALLSLTLVQFYWLSRAFDIKSTQIEQRLQVILWHTAQELARSQSCMLASENPIYKVSNNYYLVSFNCEINPDILEYALGKAFQQEGLPLDFEYGIYDCDTDQMQYGKYVRQGSQTELPQNKPFDAYLEGHSYYFGVRFPTLETELIAEMEVWYYSVFLFFIVISFFAYSFYLLLRQRRFSLAQKQFLDNMLHEFKTPVSILHLTAQVLSKEVTTARANTYVRIVGEQSAKLEHHMNYLLEHLMLENKIEKALQKEVLDVGLFLKELVARYQVLLRLMPMQGEATLDLHLCPQVCLVEADRLHLENALTNLLDNAYKYQQQEQGWVAVRLEAGAKFVQLSVQDRGQGIPQKALAYIFQPFFRVQKADCHERKGFGLGLSYVKQVVRAHRWQIKVQSSLENGTTFFIKIPLYTK